MKLKAAFLMLLMPAPIFAASDIIIQNRDYVSGTVTDEWALYTVQTGGSVTVRSGANVGFNSADFIALNPGFKVEAGGAFRASVSFDPSYSPGGYYNGIVPTLALISGDQQYGQAGQFNLLPFDIAVWNAAGTAPLVNAPVLVTINEGGGLLSATNDSGAVLSQSLHLTTDADGTVHAYYQQGAIPWVVSTVQVIAGNQVWQFSTYSYSATGSNSDGNGDGVSDAAASVLGMNAAVPAQSSTVPALVVYNP